MLLSLKLVLIFSFLAIAEESCPPERFIYGNSCYEFVEDPVTINWWYAVNQCSAKGGQLVSLETEDEHTAIVEGLVKSNLTYDQWFIGLRFPSDGGGATKWLSGATLTYDRYGENYSNFNCTTLFAFQSIWFNSPCDPYVQIVAGYICEHPREIMLPANDTVDTLTTNTVLVTSEIMLPANDTVDTLTTNTVLVTSEIKLPANVTVGILPTNTVLMTSDYSYDGFGMEENELKTSLTLYLSIVFGSFVVLIIFTLLLLFRLGKLQFRHIDKHKDNSSEAVAATVYEIPTPHSQGPHQNVITASTDPNVPEPTDSYYHEIPIANPSCPHPEYISVYSDENTDTVLLANVHPTEDTTLHDYVNY